VKYELDAFVLSLASCWVVLYLFIITLLYALLIQYVCSEAMQNI
jgi:hypothetical protein